MPIHVTKHQAKALQLTIDGGADEVKSKRTCNNEEEQHQTLLFAERDALVGKYPCLEWMFATLNGVYLPPALKQRVKVAGLTEGVLDVWFICLREENGIVCPGLVMDMKRLKGGRPSKRQLDWARHLTNCGFLVTFPAGVVDAWWTLCCYAGITGIDHFAPELQAREDLVRKITEATAS